MRWNKCRPADLLSFCAPHSSRRNVLQMTSLFRHCCWTLFMTYFPALPLHLQLGSLRPLGRRYVPPPCIKHLVSSAQRLHHHLEGAEGVARRSSTRRLEWDRRSLVGGLCGCLYFRIWIRLIRILTSLVRSLMASNPLQLCLSILLVPVMDPYHSLGTFSLAERRQVEAVGAQLVRAGGYPSLSLHRLTLAD